MTEKQELRPCPFCETTEHLSNSPCGSMTDDMPARPHRVVCNHIDCDYVQGPVGYGVFAAAEAWNTRAAVNAHHAMLEALEELEQAEAEYRRLHDLCGDGHIATGRAWDVMRRAGDKARAAIRLGRG